MKIVLIKLFIWNLFSKFNDHFSSDELQNLVDSERSFSPFHSLNWYDFVDLFPVFHHFNVCCDGVARKNRGKEAKPHPEEKDKGTGVDHNVGH